MGLRNILEKLGFVKADKSGGDLTAEERELIFRSMKKHTPFMALGEPTETGIKTELTPFEMELLQRWIKQSEAIDDLSRNLEEIMLLVNQLSEVSKKRQTRDKKRHNQWKRNRRQNSLRHNFSH